MKKFLKILGVLAGILAVLMIVLIVLAKVLVTPERVRETVVPKASEALNREVSLEDIRVSLFSGIILENLVIMEKEGEEPFVAAERLLLQYSFWPLLLGRVVVDEIILDNPRIRIERFADGRFNFSDLVGEGEKKESFEPEAAGDKKLDLLVSEVKISGGELIFLDHTLNQEAPYRFQLQTLNFEASDISLDSSFPFQASALINESPLELKGKVDANSQTGEMSLSLSNFNVTALAPYFRDQLPGELKSLQLSIDIEAQGGSEQVSSSGMIVLNNLDLAMEETPLRAENISLNYDVTANLSQSLLEIRKAEADLNGIPLHVTGTVNEFASRRILDLQVNIPPTEVRSALKALPQETVASLADLNPVGTLQANIHLGGPVENLEGLLQDGRIELTEIAADVSGSRPTLSGVLNFQGTSLNSENLHLILGENRADVDLKVQNLMGKPIQVTSQITSDRFALDPLLKSAATPAAPTSPQTEKKQESGEIGPFDLPLKAEGSIAIGETLYKGLNVNDFRMNYRLVDNVLTIEELTGKLAGGAFTQTARIDLSKPGLVYESKFGLKSIQADPLVSSFFPAAGGTVFGNLSLESSLSGRGLSLDMIKKSLTANGDLRLLEGKITGIGLLRGLAEFLNADELKVLSFSRTGGSFAVRDGKVSVDMEVLGEDIRMKPKGTIGLDGAMNLALNAAVAPELMKKIGGAGKFTQLLQGEEGWAQLPIKVGGTWNSPQFALDSSAVQEKVKEKAREKIKGKILEKIVPPGKEGEETKPGQKVLEDTLKGLFR